MSHTENQLGGFASNVNNLMDAQKDNLEDHAWIKCKLVDLEDRSRGNNIKVRRIAETVECEKCYAFTWLNCGGEGKSKWPSQSHIAVRDIKPCLLEPRSVFGRVARELSKLNIWRQIRMPVIFRWWICGFWDFPHEQRRCKPSFRVLAVYFVPL